MKEEIGYIGNAQFTVAGVPDAEIAADHLHQRGQIHEGDVHGGGVDPYHAGFALIRPENGAIHQRAGLELEAAVSTDGHPRPQ